MRSAFLEGTSVGARVAAASATAILAALLSGDAAAYDRYSASRDATNCRSCHGDFRNSPYTSLTDGQSWGDDLHDVHRNTMLGGDCDTCHSGASRFPVLTNVSAGGAGLAAISCAGCHGRTQDGTSGAVGSGAGLRQHHDRAGQTVCRNCHSDANPANKSVVGENVLPPYYASPGTGHSIPTDSCNPPPGYPENFKGTTKGLDNDGDSVYDTADSDCAVAVCGDGTVQAGEQCDDGNTTNGDCCSSTCRFEASGSTCSDGLFCTTGETCDGAGACGGGAARSCDDGIACTTDVCNETTDACDHAANDAACSDGAFCNGAETCSATLGCQAGVPVSCDDGIACTTDACNETSDACDHAASDAACSDGAFCNGVETCSATLGCQAGAPVICDDAIACTTDACNETSDACDHAASDAACSDGAFCNGVETCSATLGCQAGVPVSCDDGIACTTDACNETTDVCDHATNDAACSDGAFCNGVETCSATLGCQAGTPVSCDDGIACTTDACNETSDACDHATNDVACADGVFCNGVETCSATLGCQAGTPVICDDGIACTTDACNETSDACDFATNDAACADGLFCNGVETCSAALGCQAGTPVSCDDADICTDDSCSDASSQCLHVYDPTNDPSCVTTACGNGRVEPGEQCDDGNTTNGDCCSATCQLESAGSACDDGLFCTVGEACDGAGACSGGAPPDCGDGVACTTDTCNETTDACDHAASDAACSDGAFCNGVETCSAALGCQAGAPVSCDDGIACTTDACNETTDACDHAASDAACSDGAFCNGAETCSATLGCQAGVPVSCDDGIACTTDACNETTDVCDHAAGDAACADGLFCNGVETCSATLGCQAGTPVSCDDGVACTTDACNETTDACDHPTSDAACSDGLFCDGVETCSATLGCQAGTPVSCDDADICTDDGCNEAGDACTHVFDPTNDPSCASRVCGNGTLDGGEQCDDGNTANGDCCSSTCRFDDAGSACSDGLFCTAGEACDGAGGCVGATPRDCADGFGCTTDTCDEAADACVHAPDDTACNDGVFCNGVETCSAATGCQAGAAIDCNDADVCTDDACDEPTAACTHLFDRSNDPSCDVRCPDADGDGYSPAVQGCGAVDCDDSDAGVRPGATEVCTNDKDDDCDGLIDAADPSCETTGWSVRPGPLTNSAYAGSPACASCHDTQYTTWSRSLHARMISRPGDAQAAGFPLPGSTSIASWGDVLFVVGQKWKTLYVDRSGVLQPAQWNYAAGVWSPYAGGPYSCGACHTTGYDPVATFLDDHGEAVPGIQGAWVEYNIGCEACHGPGAEHAASPSRTNINRITLDWTSTGEGVVTPQIRSAEICGQCHWRTDHGPTLDPQTRNETEYNDWKAGPHSSTLESTTLSTYCAKCHSPGDARADSTEHQFTYFEPTRATHVACISCHDPHRISDERWSTLRWPTAGRQDPQDHPAAVGRYRGTDDDPATNDFSELDPNRTNDLCTDCHKTQPGFRRHVDAQPPTVVQLQPPYNGGQPFDVPHAEHVELGNAECVSCHMPRSRTSINEDDVRTHTLRPNEWPLGGDVHYADTCGQCHAQAQDCVWCHSDFARRVTKRSAPTFKRPLRDVVPSGRARSEEK